MPESTHPAPGPAMRPDDVPDELLDLAWRADLAHRAPGASAEEIATFGDFDPAFAESCRDALRPMVAALYGAIREQAAAEIAEPSVWPDPFGRWTADQADAARAMKEHIVRRIARGAA